MSQFRVFSDVSPDEVAEKAIRAANEALTEYGIKLHVHNMNDGGDGYEDYEIIVEAKDLI